ncbi:MAG: hypothetical protein QXR27_04940 [Archaeoglobaceae archaeon]
MNSEILLLKKMLEKAYRIETSFEDEASFKAFIEAMDEEQRNICLNSQTGDFLTRFTK